MQDAHHPDHRDKRAWGMVPTSIVENDGKRVSNAGREDKEREDDKHDAAVQEAQKKHNNETTLREAMDEKLVEAAKNREPEHHEDGSSEEAKDQPPSKANDKEIEGDDERKRKIRVKNRRKAWIDGHPEYFENPDFELSDPLLYDRCIRRFQTASEREAEGKKKGYSGVMEADMWRSEAKLAALAGKQLGADLTEKDSDGKAENGKSKEGDGLKYVAGKDGEVVPEDEDEIPQTKEEGAHRWKQAMECRYLLGRDEDFDYEKVDQDDSLDVLEREEKAQEWFEDEEPEWANGAKEASKSDGETGVQDF